MSNNRGLQTDEEFGHARPVQPGLSRSGGLVQHLIDLRDQKGMTSEEVVKELRLHRHRRRLRACRFGMYVTECHMGLRDAGPDGFGVMLFQQRGGPLAGHRRRRRPGDEPGVLHRRRIKAIVYLATYSNALGYRITLRGRFGRHQRGDGSRPRRSSPRRSEKHKNIFLALHQAKKVLAAVKVDKLQPKAKTSIIGEFLNA